MNHDMPSHEKGRLYLDHAATGWPKKPGTVEAMTRYLTQCGAAYGRGGYASARRAGEIVDQLRRLLAKSIHAESPDTISFHPSGTAALQAALFGWLRCGDHVVTTAAEHNSVLRPIEHLVKSRGVQCTIVDVNNDGRLDANAVLAAVTSETRLVAVTAVSNVTGIASPIADIGPNLPKSRCKFLVDGAQSFGWLPIDVQADGVDLFATPAHKAGGGPLGTAMLYVQSRLHEEIEPTVFGGTGSQSESLEMPSRYPNKLEAGNLNVPALAGWLAELQTWDEHIDVAREKTAQALANALYSEIKRAGANVSSTTPQIPLVSFWHPSIQSAELANLLDLEFGIEVRAGLHCAAKIHDSIGHPKDGVVRASAGPETSLQDIERLGQAISEIFESLH